MIVSYLHNFIFIKTRKTAGTSVEIALTPHCGQRDIVTPIIYEDELQRVEGELVAARNYANPELEAEYRKAILARDQETAVRIHRSLRGEGCFYNHMTAAEAMSRLPASFWKSAFKFTVERHPYEKAVSNAYYSYSRGRIPVEPFSALLDKTVREYEIDDFGLYSVDGAIVVDEVMRQESLEHDLRAICGRLGITIPGDLPRAKTRHRLDRRPAQEILSEPQKQTIFERCRRTFEAFGYER